MDVEIDEVVTELVTSDPNSGLSREEMQHIIKMVVEHLGHEQDRARQRHKDTGIRDRAYAPEGSQGGEQ